jgi:hypothetical protein
MFYKKQKNIVLEAPSVLNLKYLLTEEAKVNYILPIDGWYWFDSKEAAYIYFKVELVVEDKGVEDGYHF